MNVNQKLVFQLAKRLKFDELDTRSTTSLREFAGKLDRLDVSDDELREQFLEFELNFLNLELLADSDLPCGFFDVESHMNRKVDVVLATDRAIDVSRRLLRQMVTGFPVVDEQGRLIGVVSNTDMMNLIARPELTDKLDTLEVREIMTGYTMTSTSDAHLLDVLHLMLSFRLHRVVIIDNQSKPVGLITSLDAARILQRILRELRSAAQASAAARNASVCS